MAFTRKFLKEQGVPEDKIDTILAERNRSLGDYILKTEADEQLKKAVDEAKANVPQADVTSSEEYKALEAKVSMYSAFETEDFNNVKKPYREIVWNKLDHSEKHKPYSEQISELQESMSDLFNAPVTTEGESSKPQFGSNTQGSVPSGETKESFTDYWNFKRK